MTTNSPATVTPPPRKCRRWLRVLAALIVFVSGIVIGSAGTIIAAVHKLQYAVHHPEEFPHHIAARLEHRLSLSAEQTRQVEAILAQRQQSLMAIHREIQPQVTAQFDEGYQQIAAILTPQQRDKWQSIYTDLKHDWLPAPTDTGTQPATAP